MANVPLRPPGVKFFGVFLTPFPDGDYITQWAGGWNFAVWQAQIDAVKSIGGNFVPYFGGIAGTLVGLVSQANYIARHRQVAEYIASKGMYALCYGGGADILRDTRFTSAQYATALSVEAALLSQFANHVGYVTCDEPFAVSNIYSSVAASGNYTGAISDANIFGRVADQYAACKAAVPPGFGICGGSMPGGQNGSAVFDYGGGNQVRTDAMAPYCDFWAYHPFYIASPSEMAPVRAAYPGKDIILPSSVGTNVANTNAEKANRQAAIMAFVGSNNVRGMANWVSTDFASAPDDWGVFNKDASTPPVLTERTANTNAFRAGNTAIDLANRRTIPGKPRLQRFKEKGYA